eukprot:gene6189-9221_t
MTTAGAAAYILQAIIFHFWDKRDPLRTRPRKKGGAGCWYWLPRKCLPAPLKLQDGGDRSFAIVLTIAMFASFDACRNIYADKSLGSNFYPMASVDVS